MERYLRHPADRRRGPDPTESDRSMLAWGLGLGALVGAAAASYVMVRRDRDGLPHRPADSAPGWTAKHGSFRGYDVSARTVTIGKPKSEVYAFFRDFSNLPTFMENVSEIRQEGDLTRWRVRAPMGREVTLVTRIVRDDPHREIAWASTEESDVETKGKVMFRDAPGDRGTELMALIAYHPPGGELGKLVAKLWQAEPRIQGRRELKRLKMLLETGEIATARNHKAA